MQILPLSMWAACLCYSRCSRIAEHFTPCWPLWPSSEQLLNISLSLSLYVRLPGSLWHLLSWHAKLLAVRQTTLNDLAIYHRVYSAAHGWDWVWVSWHHLLKAFTFKETQIKIGQDLLWVTAGCYILYYTSYLQTSWSTSHQLTHSLTNWGSVLQVLVVVSFSSVSLFLYVC